VKALVEKRQDQRWPTYISSAAGKPKDKEENDAFKPRERRYAMSDGSHVSAAEVERDVTNHEGLKGFSFQHEEEVV